MPTHNDTIIEENSIDVTKFERGKPKRVLQVEPVASILKPVEESQAEEKDQVPEF